MNGQNREEKLMPLTFAMPRREDFVMEKYRQDPDYARLMIQDEFQEYVETNDIRYLLSTLRKAAEAKGWSALSRKTGLSRPLLYAALSGETDPRIGLQKPPAKFLERAARDDVVVHFWAGLISARRPGPRRHKADTLHLKFN